MKSLRLGLALALAIPTSCGGKVDTAHRITGGGAGSSAGGSGVICQHDDVRMQVGDSYDEAECVRCECKASGDIVCGEGIDCFQGCGDAYGTYRLGTTFPDPRSCGTCTCEMDGIVRCSSMRCEVSCDYAGHTYVSGEQFIGVDGCSPCRCADGSVICSTFACPCDPEREHYRKYAPIEATACIPADFACPVGSTTFANTCGCGCQQDPACPPYSECTTPILTGDPASSQGGTSGAAVPNPYGSNANSMGGAPNSAAAGSAGTAGTLALPCPTPEERAACPLSWPAT